MKHRPLYDRDVFITGGTGSFGNAFARRALADGAARVVVFSRDELKQTQMATRIADARLRFFLGDVRDPDRLHRAMRHADIVIHAAALKRIEVCEREPLEAISTNILGTSHVAAAAIDAGAAQCVLLSTDKACQPATLYGMTKSVAERLWVNSNVYAAGTRTRLAATRYGNVLGSRGSVLEAWRSQHARNEPLRITREGMTRFWMTLDEAVELVVTALREMRGGETFVPKVGSSTILDLARGLVGPTLYAPGHVETGLRVGEKMHETLIAEDEAGRTYDAGGHYIIEPVERTWGDLDPLDLPMVPEGWAYRSDTNVRQLTPVDLGRLAA